jgi:hypothetical protein
MQSLLYFIMQSKTQLLEFIAITHNLVYDSAIHDTKHATRFRANVVAVNATQDNRPAAPKNTHIMSPTHIS